MKLLGNCILFTNNVYWTNVIWAEHDPGSLNNSESAIKQHAETMEIIISIQGKFRSLSEVSTVFITTRCCWSEVMANHFGQQCHKQTKSVPSCLRAFNLNILKMQITHGLVVQAPTNFYLLWWTWKGATENLEEK